MKKYLTNNFKQTQKIGEDFARVLSSSPSSPSSPRRRGSRSRIPNQVGNDEQGGAIIIALYGNLGGGKTTFLQGFAKGLGIKEKILSPTFVIMKKFGNFYHIDCYRLNKPEDILELGWEKIIHPPAGGPKNIIAIEWPEKIKKLLPKNAIKVEFKFISENKREIRIKL